MKIGSKMTDNVTTELVDMLHGFAIKALENDPPLAYDTTTLLLSLLAKTTIIKATRLLS